MTTAPIHPARAGALAVLLAAALLPVRAPAETITVHRASADSLRQPPVEVNLEVHRQAIPPSRPPIPAIPTPKASDKVHPLLRQAIGSRPGQVDTVLVTFRDPILANRDTALAIIGNPMAPDSIRGFLPATQVESMLTARRLPLYRAQAGRLRAFRAQVLRTYWITQALLIRMPLNQVYELAGQADVVRIDPLLGEGAPQPPVPEHCAAPVDRLHVARTLIGSEPFRLAGFGAGRIALLDTGVMDTHPLLKDRIERRVDCTSGSGRLGDPATCEETRSQSDEYAAGHGTSSAALLAANDVKGEENRGVTDAMIASYRVFRGTNMLPAWVGAAFQDALTHGGYDPIVAEVVNHDGGTPGAGIIAAAASLAYQRGVMVIAANGNSMADVQQSGLPEPAKSPFAIGVGMYCMMTPNLPRIDAAWGNTADLRIKPEVGAPTGVLTAANNWDPGMRSFPGTSGSTPLVAGAALLLRNWMKSGGAVVTPGDVYAMLILSGQRGRVDRREGAGPIRLPSGGTVWWHPVEVAYGQSVTLDLETPGSTVSQLDAAIWWPEFDTSMNGLPAPSERAWITLELQDPDGRTSPVSDVPLSVFQRASLSRDSQSGPGTWKLKISAPHVPHEGTRQVFFAAWARP